MLRFATVSTLCFGVCIAVPPLAAAVPGPATTAVVANANIPQSVALAEAYAAFRSIPEGQVCAVDVPADVPEIPLSTFETDVRDALRSCLQTAGVLDRIEAVVLVRGVPIRVGIDVDGTNRPVSLAAALALHDSTSAGAPVLCQSPGRMVDCGGTPCFAAFWPNPFRTGVFEPEWTVTQGEVVFRPWLVTMLHGRTYEDAALLVDSARNAEAAGGADGEFLLMEARNPPRAILDPEIDTVVAELQALGLTATRAAFDADASGRSLAGFTVGADQLGDVIEGNEFAPGALVDNLTSFGAVPQNFEPSGQSQVSIARWVARGVGGVHGTTAEPLSNAFPSRAFLVDYARGSTLAEAYHRWLPFVYWQNLVLGDPMLAPYATRPEVSVEGVADGATVTDAIPIVVTAADSEPIGVDSIVLYVDGVEVARSDGRAIEHCLAVTEGQTASVLAVAQKRDDGSPRGIHRPKGWLAFTVEGAAGLDTCVSAGDAGMDAGGAADAGAAVDAGAGPPGDDGCGCITSGAPSATRAGAWTVMLALAAALRRRKR